MFASSFAYGPRVNLPMLLVENVPVVLNVVEGM